MDILHKLFNSRN